jgi:hypothetical protein
MRSVLWQKAKIPGRELSKDELEAVLLSSSKGFSVLREILKDRLAAVVKERASKEGYDSPAWPYFQADCNARERELRQLLDILDPVCYNTSTD